MKLFSDTDAATLLYRDRVIDNIYAALGVSATDLEVFTLRTTLIEDLYAVTPYAETQPARYGLHDKVAEQIIYDMFEQVDIAGSRALLAPFPKTYEDIVIAVTVAP